jgi:stage V sporulation protein G
MKIITDESKGSLKAFVTLNIAGAFIVKGLRVVQGPKGLFVAMPQEKYQDKKTGKDKWADTAETAKGFQKELNETIIKVYEARIKKSKS